MTFFFFFSKQKVLKKKDVFSHKGIKRLILKHAKKLQVDDEENIEDKIDKLKEILNEFMSENDSDSGNLIKFPGKKNLH